MCHPFTFGYVRGAVEQIVDTAALGDRPIVPWFVRVAAIVEVWGLELRERTRTRNVER